MRNEVVSASRRHFLKVFGTGALGTALLPSVVRAEPEEKRLVILHTNDTHSRIEPFPMDGGRNQGLGGVARRAALISQIRSEHQNVLLLDSGDIFQGTPYFNFYGGEVEFRSMSAMRYDVSTMGNHDFDNGVNGFVNMLPHATFDFVSANYAVDSGSPLRNALRPWVIRETGGIRVGIFGLGISFKGLVLDRLHEGVRYEDPIASAREAIVDLRDRRCDLVVCLSHLGFQYDSGRVSDVVLAREVPEIDIILGGHTHTFLNEPFIERHPDGRNTMVNQVGFAGIRLGRIDVSFAATGSSRTFSSAVLPVDSRFDVV